MEHMNDQSQRNIADEAIYDYEEITTKEISKFEEAKVFPTYTNKEINKAYEDLNEASVKQLSNEEKVTLEIATESTAFINPDDIGVKQVTDDITNNPETGDGKLLKLKNLVINKRVKSSKAALMKLTQKVGIGDTMHVPLWHSGFWITLTPLDSEEIISLEIDLLNELSRVGKDTATLAFSNYSVLFVETIMKHVLLKIRDTSLDIDDIEEIGDYISINDMPIIALALARSMYPNGFHAVIPCKNVAVVEDGVPKCTNKVHSKLNLDDLLFVDLSKLTKEQINIMSKKAPKSVTIDEIVKYRELFLVNMNGDVIVNNAEGEFTVSLEVPSISKYLEFGNYFINDLREKAQEIFTNNKKFSNIEDAEKFIVKSLYVQLYNHYVSGIHIDAAVIDPVEDITEALAIISSGEGDDEFIIDEIKKYIDKSIIAVVGIPNFVCPICQESQVSDEIIPLSVYEYFFILLHSRYKKIVAKMNKSKKS